MSGLRAWFLARSRREQRLLAVMVALLLVTIVWFGIVRPVGDGLESSRERYADAVQRLGETQAQARAVAAIRRSAGSAAAGPLDAAVRNSADQAGFTLASLNGLGPDRVDIAITSARPAALVAWVARLEAQGILVEQLATTDNGDRTVSAHLTLAARGA